MRLERLRLRAYRQFIDEELRLDRRLTVIVGRNDTGKTGLLNRFFDQYIFESVISSADKPHLPRHSRNRIAFELDWRVEPTDYKLSQFINAFGASPIEHISLSFESSDTPAKMWRYAIDGRSIDTYESATPDGQPILREVFDPRNLFPRPIYISRAPAQGMFAVRLADVAPYPRNREQRLPSSAERSLMEFAKLPAAIRPISNKRWPAREVGSKAPDLRLSDVETRLAEASEHLTGLMRHWWTDPPNITVRIRLTGSEGFKRAAEADHQYTIVFEAIDASGLPLQGAGFRWFLTFLVEIELLRRNPHPLLVLFDEPATPLHPSAQRMAARVMDSLSGVHQVIYSTHSPFMIDWNYPQRVRLLERDPSTRRTRISNTPWAGGSEGVWDPLRTAIGVTVGDVAVVGQSNILVEGITDQIIIANAAAALAEHGNLILDIDNTTVIPYGEEPSLLHLFTRIRGVHGVVVVLTDNDAQGKKVQARCRREKVRSLAIIDAPDTDASVEDIIGLRQYVDFVNRVYAGFTWFRPIDASRVEASKGPLSLGRFFNDYFDREFDGQSFSKVAVAIFIADSMRNNLECVPQRLVDLLRALAQALSSHLPP